MPAYLVVFILGHVLIPIIVAVSLTVTLPTWVEMTMWPVIALSLAMIMIQPAKGAVIGFQWARRMHGFSGGR